MARAGRALSRSTRLAREQAHAVLAPLSREIPDSIKYRSVARDPYNERHPELWTEREYVIWIASVLALREIAIVPDYVPIGLGNENWQDGPYGLVHAGTRNDAASLVMHLGDVEPLPPPTYEVEQ